MLNTAASYSYSHKRPSNSPPRLVTTFPIRPLIIRSMVDHKMHCSMPLALIVNQTAGKATPLGTRIQVILEHLCKA